MKSLCFLSTLGILYFSSVIQNVKSLEPCREGFTPQKCCSYNFVQENGQRKCNLMIPESTYLIYAADTLYLNCDPGFDGGSSGCSWRLPSGESCTFLATDLLPNSKVCSADSSITLTSNLSLGICNIMVANVQYKHEGNWSCSVTASSKYFDNTYVEISNGMKTSTILAITIPVSLLVIAIGNSASRTSLESFLQQGLFLENHQKFAFKSEKTKYLEFFIVPVKFTFNSTFP